MNKYLKTIMKGEEEALKDINYDIDNRIYKSYYKYNRIDLLSMLYDYGYINTYNNLIDFYRKNINQNIQIKNNIFLYYSSSSVSNNTPVVIKPDIPINE